ncbi:hypothetical protein APUTEX25_002544 [Auxenochlorella protothecoides]|uniref:Uncharacterized protein n=1 Tax=Auxenochlorella protothecoides TaxID=3075 RepID=A0A3M7KUE4_AUXPR|nr:hypothetical protein APUTEX25_002544 [Auxenochlorella protothecoides]|eukprot:RMZ53967.1 hypothetical protein APUTEX25_002544 [Auxenochlorella protothecoides]
MRERYRPAVLSLLIAAGVLLLIHGLIGYPILTSRSGTVQRSLLSTLVSKNLLNNTGAAGDDEELREWLRGARSLGRRVVLRYSACGGLINQQYSHLSAFILATALRAEVVLPPACFRNSFGLHYDMDIKRNKMEWFTTPVNTLLDVPRVIENWKALGIKVYETPGLQPAPNLTQPSTAFPAFIQRDVDPRLILRLPDVYLARSPLAALVARSRATLARHLRDLDPGLAASTDYLVLDLPCTFFALRTARIPALATRVAALLPFNAALEALAARTVAAMAAAGVPAFNGVHLRVEKDAGDWTIIMGGVGRMWHLYTQTMRRAGLDARTPLYVATGLLTYGASKEWAYAQRVLLSKGLASRVVIKNQFVPAFELAELNTEQQALLDFLILARAVRFVGFGSSTFSYYLTQHRRMRGHAQEASLLVDAARIGTDAMFEAAAVITHPPLMHVVQ